MLTAGSENKGKDSPPRIPSELEASILDMVRSLSFGSVEITVHNGRIVQVERREKIRVP